MSRDDELDEVRGALATLLDPEPPMRSSVADDVRRGRAQRYRRQRWVAGGVAAALVLGVAGLVGLPRLTGGTDRPVVAGPAATSGVERPATYDPTTLFGYWNVGGTGTADDGATLQFGSMQYEGSVTLYRTCGGLDGSWVASPAGGFVAFLDSGDSSCFPDTSSRWQSSMPTWLVAADAYRATGDGVTLLDRDGGVVATLAPGARPTVGPNRSADGTKPFDVTPETRALFAARVVPGGVTPATSVALVGRWLPGGDQTGKAYLRLDADGTYRSSDGCNSRQGRWTVDGAGVPLATSGVSTAVGCLGVDSVQWLTQARAATVAGGTLTLLDGAGKAIGTLTR